MIIVKFNVYMMKYIVVICKVMGMDMGKGVMKWKEFRGHGRYCKNEI